MKPTICSLFSSLVLAATSATPLTAQDPLSPQAVRQLLQDLRLPVHAEFEPDGASRGLWTAGSDWTASLQDGVQFQPLQPSDGKPTPWRWRTTGLRLGQQQHDVPTAAPVIAHDYRCEFPRGAIVEAYDVHSDGLEQTFVLQERMTHDLVLTGAVTTDLRAEPRDFRHAPIEFHSPDGGNGMRYGAATAIDARGHRLPLATAWDGAELHIAVPGAWLAAAALPVIVDPLLQTVLMQVDSGTVHGVAIERDEANSHHELAIAVTRGPAGSSDLVLLLVDDALGNATPVFSRLSSHAEDPQLAYVRGSDTWLLGWTSFDYLTFQDRSVLHLHGGADTQYSVQSQWAPNLSGRVQRGLRLGGNRDSGPSTTALLVWESEPAGAAGNTTSTRVYGALFDSAAGTASTPFLLGGDGHTMFPNDSESPSVSRDRGIGSWLVVWQHLGAGLPAHWDVVGRRIDVAGNLAAGSLLTDQTGTLHQLAPVVDGRHGDYLVVFGTLPFGSAVNEKTATVLRAQRFLWQDGSAAPLPQGPSQVLQGPTSPAGLRARAVAHDKGTTSHWAVASTAVVLTSETTSLQLVGHDAKPRETFFLGSSAKSAGVAFDAGAHQFVYAYGHLQNGNRCVSAVRYAYPAQAAPTLYGQACSAAANGASGSFLVGDRHCRLRLQGAPGNSLAIVACALDAASAPLPAPFAATCNLLVDVVGAAIGIVPMLTDATGYAELPLPLSSTLPDFQLHVQWIHADPAGELRATQGLRIEVR